MSISPVRYTFSCPSGGNLSELDEENPIDEIEVKLSQLFIGTTCKGELSEDMKFPTISEGAMQNWNANYHSSRRKY